MRATGMFLTFALFCTAPQVSAQALSAEQGLFREIYRELVEIDTTHSAGDTTRAARAMQARLRTAGFATEDLLVFEPFPKKGNLVARLRGTGQSEPLLLLAHIDVVEARKEDWNSDPFELQERDGYFTARGSLDDKAMAAAFVSILGQLKREGFAPRRDIVLALTADEERGDVPSNGVQWLMNNQPELLQAAFGINEGGSGELREGRPTLNRLQVAEKLYVTYEFETTNRGGHSSQPREDNAIYELAEALGRLARLRFPVRISEVTKVYFERSAALASGQLADDMRAVAREEPDPEAARRLSALPQYNALLRTTCVATMLEAGHAENALPQSARVTVNCRILPGDDPDAVDRELRQALGDRVAVKAVRREARSPPSPLSGEVVDAVEAVTAQMWPGVPVVPSMSSGATDSRFLRSTGVPMYGVSGIFVDPADNRIHGLNERVEVKRLYEGREFLYLLVKRLAE
jgi:acetylornithine deacetylase/succinyl-diaminopimelate desuccinylase-like protein